MFGEKAQKIAEQASEIERLITERDFYKGQADNPYLRIGEELQLRVSKRISDASENDLTEVMTDEVAVMEDELVAKGLRARIEAMPPEKVLRMYAKAVGQEEIIKQLGAVAEMHKSQLDDQVRWASIATETLKSGVFDLRHVRKGEVVEVGAFAKHLGDNTKSYVNRTDWAARVLVLRAYDTTGDMPIFETLSDTIRPHNANSNDYKFSGTGRYLSTYAKRRMFNDHELVRLGTRIETSDDSFDFQPTLTRGTDFYIAKNGDDPKHEDYDIGYVRVGNDRPVIVLGGRPIAVQLAIEQ